MKKTWNLDALYPSFESEEFQGDFQLLQRKIQEMTQWAEENLKNPEQPVEKLKKVIADQEEVGSLMRKLMTYANLRAATNAKDEEATKYMEKINKSMTDLTKASVLFNKWLKERKDLKSLIDSSEKLREYEFYLMEKYQKTRYLLREEEEVTIAKMQETGSKAWSNLQNVISSTLMVDIELEGKKQRLPLPAARNLAFHKDPEVRKKGYEAELKAYEKIEESSAAALNGIKGEVLTTTKMRGYESPLEETVLKSRIDQKTLDAMLTAMKESLPKFREYYKRKGELLGHENGLPLYDMFAPMGEADMGFSYEEARDYILKNFKTFSSELEQFTKKAFDNEWIDAEPREGKRGGAFCANIHPIGESRILANFNGSFSNMTTLAHELGHAFHGDCLKNEHLLNSGYTMPIAETASIFCETIVVNAALKEADKKEAFTILEANLQGAGQVIVDIMARFLFESKVFEIREDHALSVQELKDTMIWAQKQAYGEGLDHDALHPYMWVNKPHYYSAGLSFYNFPYAFGLLFAKGVYAEYLKRGEAFVPEYTKLLKATGKNEIKDVAKMVGIDVQDPQFWKSSLELIEQDIDEFIRLSKEV
ncbi:M3 family oligoendopeptidase [Isachenkonia alkalipeptolytica]|uniref:M3 family oligoendopeptidase n=1 Tax=Isachenkonia alkalipeptolytica TaxID=2565777 RepID=A0AA44BE90_9CLOT|nr:M3 family oligoendopeptidase [Isachenkonia alkalipeptolytica]NBG87236.1 M3 family oligoendopeptidase [Isachenkonia alkalipeptolytica]